MPRYDFAKEVEEIAHTGRFPESFFKKLEALAKSIAKGMPFPARFIDPVAVTWSKETYQEFASGFFVDFLCHGENKRLKYLIVLVMVKKADVDYLLKKMFEQYRDELIKKNYPYRANINDRIRCLLDLFIKKGILEKRLVTFKEFKRIGVTADTYVTDDDLKNIEKKLPQWRTIPFNPDSQFASAIISNVDLEKIIYTIFEFTEGWIVITLLNSFLHRFLKIPEVSFVSPIVIGPDGEELPLEELIGSGDIQADPSLLTKLKMAYEEMTPRQRIIFLLLCEGYTVAEISAKTSVSNSTIFNEIRVIMAIIKRHLSE